MHPLDKTLRNALERTVKDGREVAEAAARAALEQLGVGEATAFPHLSGDERELRRRLRVHGRQLGDLRDSGAETQALDRLTEEVAYEHWHRMLFARFLAENDLLMYPDPDGPVPVTLEECDDLAPDEGAANGWELASRYAARMLPQIFRTDSPVFQLVLPPEHQQTLERLVGSLAPEVFTAADSLGWVYQFWQAKRKEEVNASEVKIGARELPAVTQLFTEPYMVDFLLDNSLGAWWAARRLSAGDFAEAATNGTNNTKETERELRQRATIPGVPLEYLRFVQQEDGTWTPAAGTFSDWPEDLSDLTTLDPCCGSGHFLVAAFLMLVPMRMELEGLSACDAADAVLRQNIHGLELDQRCVELAAFALALTAWRYPGAGGYRPLPELHLACSGLSVSVAKAEWKQLALDKHNLRIAMDWMHDEFRDAPVLGSLLNPAKGNAAKIVDWQTLAPALEEALRQDQTEEQHEAAVVAHGLAKAAQLLAGRYAWVITNVPYLKRGKQDETLREFCDTHYKTGRNDLATVFLERCLELCTAGGTSSIVLPQNWLFLTSYRKFREKLLRDQTWHLIARLGAGAFETISGEVVKAILISISRGGCSQSGTLWAEPAQGKSGFFRGLDVSEPRTAAEKSASLLTAEIKIVEQAKQLENPDARVALDSGVGDSFLSCHATSSHGQGSFDSPRFSYCFWELLSVGNGWIPQQSSPSSTVLSGGCTCAFRWQEGSGDLWAMMEAKKLAGYTSGKWRAGVALFGRKGVLVNQMGKMPVTLYLGSAFDENASVIAPCDETNLPAIWCFLASSRFQSEVKRIDQALKVTCSTLVKVPFDLAHWTKVAQEKYPHGLPQPYSDDPTQWIFHGHPCGSVVWDEETKRPAHGPLRTDATVLQTAVARLLGYRWPAELDAEMGLAAEQREWVDRCAVLLPLADEDGIVCIPPVRGEAAGADRLLNLLVTAYGDAWSNDVLAQLLQSVDHAGKALDTWLRDKFFTQHCKLFQHRPFIWHVWDGLRDGFAALVNYHKLDRKNLETLIYTYLGDWISRQKDDAASHVDGAEERLAAAEQLKKRLEMILAGEAPHDIFVRWKPTEQQPIGWDPDLNDGVRLNIRPFLSVPDVKKKNAGVLRDKPNVHWKKDRGKDVPSAPWYDLGLQYEGNQGDRINDHHLTLAEKQAARARKRK
jgi:hypothetical protein